MPYVSGWPSNKFAFTRSYVYGIASDDQPNDYATLDGGVLTVVYNSTSGYRSVYNIRNELLAWSSNRYTLDWCVTSAFWYGSWTDVPHVHGWSVRYDRFEDTQIKVLVIANAYATGFWRGFPIASQPADYWLPQPYPG